MAERNLATFDEVFETATGRPPYPFQRRFAESVSGFQLTSIPTGLGKTAMAVLGWLWRRRFADLTLRSLTPRRLVYCLPMRVLVEQTRDVVHQWLQNLELANSIPVTVLMGGEESDDWDLFPEGDSILIGTQDMLLSRALNRGYGMSRARWPLAFGLLNTDCLWVFDEIQLMGSGLATTAQLAGLRPMLANRASLHSTNSHGCQCLWMSATMQRNWLKTVDCDPAPLKMLQLEADDLNNKDVTQRHEARKPISRADASFGEFDKLAIRVLEEHGKFKDRTLVVMNTVKRARSLFDAIVKDVERTSKKPNKKGQSHVSEIPKLVLLHSRFRPRDRDSKVKDLLAEAGSNGIICVSTQVVEAGVDVSSTTLFTELAPWASLVQRFGRCNRRGDDPNARVFWIDMPKDGKKGHDAARPYEPNALQEAHKYLENCDDVGPSRLPPVELSFEPTYVVRRKDLVELFDTTPDLAGNDIDIDRYVRDIEETDVRVFWRAWNGTSPPVNRGWRRIAREELCPAQIGEFREFVEAKSGRIWRWDFLEGEWVRVDAKSVYPGQTYLVHAEAGGYESDRGWNPKISEKVTPEKTESSALTDVPAEESTDDDPLSGIGCWQTIAEHTDQVCAQLSGICASLHLCEDERHALEQAVRWHDWGKVHHVFQNAIDDGQVVNRAGKAISRRQRPNTWQGCRTVAKAPDKVWKNGRFVDSGWWRRYDWLPHEGRKHFRHELASALGVLGLADNYVPAALRDLVAYLIAAHHGKVRLSIRSLPGEKRPGKGLRFARGIWEGDELPAVELGGGVIARALKLSLEPMELGLCEYEPFTGQPSWAERMTRLRDNLGPFNLSYLEAIMRAADMRASRAAEQREAEKLNHEADHQRKEAVRG